MADDIRARTVMLEHKLNDQKARIVNLEKWQQEQNIANAVRDERWTSISARLNKIDANVAKLVWLIIGGIIAAFIAFVVGGGLRIP